MESKAKSPPKKNRHQSKSESDIVSKASCYSTSQIFHIDITQYCPSKIFYIFFVLEDNEQSFDLLNNIVKTSKNFEDISSLTFINYEDVYDLLNVRTDLLFPNQLKPLLLKIIENINNQEEPISLDTNALLIKLKLIQTMYEQYVNEVRKNQKEKHLEDLLGSLSKECRKKQKKDPKEKNKSPRAEEGMKKNKKDLKETNEDVNYAEIPLAQNDISFDQNIFDNIKFYCITGFYEVEILTKLIQDLAVPINAIIKVTDTKNIETISELLFFKNIERQFFGNTTSEKSWEDTVLMQFTPKENDVIKILQEFLFMLRRLVDLQLTHLSYLKHLTIHSMRNKYYTIHLHCMRQYNKILNNVSPECSSFFMILNTLLTQTIYNIEDHNALKNSTSNSTVLSRRSSVRYSQCNNPLQGTEAFSNEDSQNALPYIKIIDDGIIHECNILLKILKNYKNGPFIFDTTVSLLKRNPLYDKLIQSETNTEDIPHTHDLDPACKLQNENPERLNHFMYLCLFNFFSNTPRKPKNINKYDLIRNLETYDLNKCWYSHQPYILGSEDDLQENNIYDTPTIYYIYKEMLNHDIMVQELFKASEEYSYMESKFSPETDNLLILFSDTLDEFGINSKIFENHIRTPICIRDFSRYITVIESKWVKKHIKQTKDEYKLEDKFDLKERCPGVFKIKNELKIFEEYLPLLRDDEIEENTEDTPTLNDKAETEQNSLDYFQTLSDLQNYPNSINLKLNCDNTDDEKLTSYDFGSNIFMITGHETTFCSHDRVKVTVDNTRFIQDSEKCTVKIYSDENILILHSSEALTKKPYIIKLLLKNEIRISFVLNQKIALPVLSEDKLEVLAESLENLQEEEIIQIEYPENPDEIAHSIDNTVNPQTIHCIEENQVQDLFGAHTIEELPLAEDINDLLDSIYSQEPNTKIYKVQPPTKYLQRLNTSLNLPVEHVLKKILSEHDVVFQKTLPYEKYTKQYQTSNQHESILDMNSLVDFRICLPNGLFIRSYPDEDNVMIKQEYASDKPKIKIVEHEEFRIFTNQGVVLIKKVDGTIIIYRSNGDIISFDKPNDGIETYNVGTSCRCATIEDYKNKLNKLLRDEENSNCYTSRRAHITTRQNHIIDAKLLDLLHEFDVPFLKKTITKFNGQRIKIQEDKVSEKQVHYLTSQQDIFTDELVFERSDNFMSVLSKNGLQTFQFPDGTTIITCIDLAEELVDGFVYVIISFEYKHPYYIDVSFEPDKTVCISLPDDVVLKKPSTKECLKVEIKQDIAISISKDKVLFDKSCSSCLQKCSCILNVKPFGKGHWIPEEGFLDVKDSYEKEFYCDFIGNCSRSSKYIPGKLNKMQCNHYVLNEYKKLFVVNRDLGGEQFLTKFTVDNYINLISQCDNGTVNKYTKIGSNPDIKQIDCRKNLTTRFRDRFFNKLYNMRELTEKNKEDIIYSTFRTFLETFQAPGDLKEHIENLRKVFFTIDVSSTQSDVIFRNIASLTENIEQYDVEVAEDVKSKYNEDFESLKMKKCPCVKKMMTVHDKVKRWKNECVKYRNEIRKKKYPSYFLSEFCKIKGE